jgi:hypothetical protein
MITTTETAVTITIWALAAAGGFFGTRAAWRRRKQRRAERPTGSAHQNRT